MLRIVSDKHRYPEPDYAFPCGLAGMAGNRSRQ